MKKIIIVTAAALAVGIGGVAVATSSATADTWQDNLRNELVADWDTMTETEQVEGCAAMSMFGITTAQAFADFAVEMGLTAEDLTEDTNVDPASIESIEEAALIAGEVLVEQCEF